MKSTLRRFGVLHSLIALILLSTASIPSIAEQGIVVDKTTGKPIAKAVVAVTWQGIISIPPEARSKCFKVEITTTDEKGQFEVSSFSGDINPLMTDKHRGAIVLAPGYKKAADWDPKSLRIPMEPRTGSKSEQFKELPRFPVMGCTTDNKALLPYFKALYDEMTSLATTKEERLRASGILFTIEEIELGQQEAARRAGPRDGEIRRAIQ